MNLALITTSKSSSRIVPQRGCFRFLDLPAELRNLTYAKFHESKTIWIYLEGSTKELRYILQLAQTNQQIRYEVLEYLFRNKEIAMEQCFLPRFHRLMPRSTLHTIRRLFIGKFHLVYTYRLDQRMQRYLDSANGSPPVWRGPLQHVFPALQELEVQLDAESCVHRAVFVVLYTWPHTKDVTAKDLLPCPGVKWLRRNRDLKTFRLRAEECANFNCFLCKNDRAHMHDIVQDLSKLIRDEVVGTPTTTETPH